MRTMTFKYIIIYLNAIQIAIATSNYCAITFENVHCENTTMNEFKLLVDSYKNKIYNLSIKHSDLKVIEEYSFIGYADLRNLNLDCNNLLNLKSNAFSNLSSLESLSVKNNSITNLNPDIFDGLINVKFLYLDYNNVKILPFRTFSKLIALEQLTLSHNSVRRINSNTFSGSNLLKVDLSFNEINTLTPYSFSYRESKIETINLSHNKLTIIQPKVFAYLPKLQNLNLANNQLINMDFVDAFKNIRYLDLKSNNITSISDSIIKLDKLKVLNLANNFVIKIDIIITNVLPNLRALILYNNRISCSWYKENYANITENIYLQSYNLTVLPETSKNTLVFECFNEDEIPNMVLLKGSRSLYETSENKSNCDTTCENANDFGFYEIYFWLSLGAVGVYTVTTICANCMRRSEAHQNLRRNNMIKHGTEEPTLYTFNVTTNGTLPSHISNKTSINGSQDIDKRGYEYGILKK